MKSNQSQDIFEKARKAINPGIIEKIFPGGKWQNKEYVIRSPLRGDNKPGSFYINEQGLFFDFATDDCGDFIDLISESESISKLDAARMIVDMSGRKSFNLPSIRAEKPSSALQPKRIDIHIPESVIESFKPNNAAGIWVYRKDDGSAWSVVVRFNEPDGIKKVIPYHFDGKEWKTGNPVKDNRPLFNSDKLSGNNLPALVVEGEKCASISVNGFISVTWIGGSHSVDKSDFSLLKDRRVIIWPDADEPGIHAAQKIKALVPHAEILKIEGREKGWDIVDALNEGIDLFKFIEECSKITELGISCDEKGKNDGEKKGRPRKSNQAMELLKQFPICKFKDKRYMIRGNQAIQIGSRSYKEFIASEYFRAKGEPLTSIQIDEVVSIHRAHAGESEERQVYIRTAAPSSIATYIDLNDGKNTIIQVDAEGWRVSENPSVLFFRPSNMESLPMPSSNGSIEHLKEVFNLERDEDFPVMVAALCYILRGRPNGQGSYPIIVATGIEGSAKTTFMKIVKKIVDPGTPETRTPSNDTKDLFIAAHNGLVLSLDNISYINREMSDALCSLTTGGGFARKKNYSDDEEQIFDLCRPILLNGISFTKAPDLLSRSIIIELRPIPHEERKTETEIWSRVENYRSSIFGGLLSMLSKAIREETKMKGERFNLPRLADFGLFSIALERGNGWEAGKIASSLKASYDAALGENAEGNPLIPTIVRIVKETGAWSGTATELLTLVNEKSEDAEKRLSLWPKTAQKLGALLRRDHNVFVSQGIMIYRSRGGSQRRWELSTKLKPNVCSEIVPNFKDCFLP